MIYNHKYTDIIFMKFYRQRGRCAACNKIFSIFDSVELAHICPQRKWLIKKYGKEIIHHPLNMKLTHTGECNSSVQISPNKTALLEEHIDMIRNAIEKEKDNG